jgi:hypothetical protein
MIRTEMKERHEPMIRLMIEMHRPPAHQPGVLAGCRRELRLMPC